MKKLDNTVKTACRGASKGIRFANVFLATAFLFLSGLHLSAQTAIGANTPDPSAMLDVQSNERGVLFPRMTTAERILINPAPGLMIFNTTENCLQINVGTTGNPDWRNFLISSTVGGLTCGSAMVTGSLFGGQLASGVSISLPYTGGTGGGYLGEAISSTGVTGLTATLQPGTFATGSGTLTFNITGTPASAGTASFAVNIGGQSCTLSASVAPPPITLDCNAAIRKGEMQPNDPIIATDGVTFIVPYAGGSGNAHLGQTVVSTGITGYTATLAPGSFASGSGTLTYTITGTGGSTGTASFQLDIGGSSCALDLSVMSCSAKITASTSKNFLCYNLGAYNTRVDPFTPSWEINGGYWQWGRKAEAGAGPLGPGADQANIGPVAGWNTTAGVPGDWADGSKTANDPCPSGFRVPRQSDWQNVFDNNTPSTVVGTDWTGSPDVANNYLTGRKFGTTLYLPAAGARRGDGSYNGELWWRGNQGIYTSSSHAGNNDGYLLFFTNSTVMWWVSNGVLNGNSVRCIAE